MVCGLWGLCANIIIHTILPPSPVILWIELGGKPRWLPLNFGYHDVMRTVPIPKNMALQWTNLCCVRLPKARSTCGASAWQRTRQGRDQSISVTPSSRLKTMISQIRLMIVWCETQSNFDPYPCVVLALTMEISWKKVSRQRPRSAMPWKTLEKSGLEPAAPNRLADRKHCALSTQPNPYLLGMVDGDLGHLAESIKRSASDRRGDLVPQVRARTFPGFFMHGTSRPLSWNFLSMYYTAIPRPTPLL